MNKNARRYSSPQPPRRRTMSSGESRKSVTPSHSHTTGEVGDGTARKSTMSTGGGENVVEISHWPYMEPVLSSIRLSHNMESSSGFLGSSWRKCNCCWSSKRSRMPLNGIIEGPIVPIDTSVLPIDYFAAYKGNIKRESTALIALDGTTRYTYEDLNILSDHMAKLLKPIIEKRLESKHAKVLLNDPDFEVCIGVAIKPSEKWVIIALSIWKLGLPYLPIRIDENPPTPTRRIAKTIEAISPIVLIASKFDGDFNKAIGEMCHVINFEEFWQKVELQRKESSGTGAWSPLERMELLKIEGLAVDTTDPGERTVVLLHRFSEKGDVLTTHVRNCTIWNRVHAEWRDFPYSENETVGLYAAVDFYEVIGQIFTPLLAGVSIVAMNMEDLYGFAENVTKWNIQRLQVFPELLRAIIVLRKIWENSSEGPFFESVKFWFCTGGCVRRKLAHCFFQNAPKYSQLINLYGCKDSLSFVCYERFNSLEEIKKGEYYDILPIGRPVINTRIYILDKDSMVTENSGLGEVYISGLGIVKSKSMKPVSASQGESTKYADEKVSPNPNLSNLDHPMFRVVLKTGDFGKLVYSDANKHKFCGYLLKDQPTLQFEGNEEGQGIVQNYRINTHELIFYIKSLPEVKACHVMVYRPGTQSMAILAFVVVSHRQHLSKDDVHLYLRDRVPKYMLPTTILIPGIPIKDFKINNAQLVETYQKERVAEAKRSCHSQLLGYKNDTPEMRTADVLFRVLFHCCGVVQEWVANHMDWSLQEVNVQVTSLPKVYKELRRSGYCMDMKTFFTVKTPHDILKLMVKNINVENIAAQQIQGNTCGQFVVEVVSAKSKNEIVKFFLRSNFGSSHTDGVFYHCGMCNKDVKQTIIDVWPLVALKPYSIAVRDKNTKMLVAALLNADHATKANFCADWKSRNHYPNMYYYAEILDEIDQNLLKGLKSSKILQTLFFLVDPKLEYNFVQSIQVVKLLITKAIEVIRAADFRTIHLPIFDYVYSTMVVEAFDFDSIGSTQINTFETKDGAKPFFLAPDNISGTVLRKFV